MNFMPKKIHKFFLKCFPLKKLSLKFEGNLGLHTWVSASFWQKSYIINSGWQFQKDYTAFFSQISIQYISLEHLYSSYSRIRLFFLFKNIQRIQYLVKIEFPKCNIHIKLPLFQKILSFWNVYFLILWFFIMKTSISCSYSL